jgi:hypothetical protein
MMVMKRKTTKPKFVCTDIHRNCTFFEGEKTWKNEDTGDTYQLCEKTTCSDKYGNFGCVSRKAREDVMAATRSAIGFIGLRT